MPRKKGPKSKRKSGSVPRKPRITENIGAILNGDFYKKHGYYPGLKDSDIQRYKDWKEFKKRRARGKK